MLDTIVQEPFLGFQPEALKFFKSLSNKKNNNTEWFARHKHIYEAYIKEPMKNLIDTLAPQVKKIDPDIVVSYKSIFRINRDIRFTKDKHPYKNYYSAAFAFETVKSSEIPQFYFHFTPGEFLIAGGQYSSDPDKLKKIRKGITENFSAYKKIISDKKFRQEYGEVRGEKMTKLPKGYENIKDPDPFLLDVLKNKQFYVEKYYDVGIIHDTEMIDVIIENIKLMHKFVKFLHNVSK
jgi:uncharacterized protein (TIGR02453 family)